MRQIFLVLRRAVFLVLFAFITQVQADSDKYASEAFIGSSGF
jgi:hypothetical protein